MNKIIQDLSIKALEGSVEKPLRAIYFIDQAGLGFREKFAKLVAEECIKQCNSQLAFVDEYSDDDDFIYNHAIKECIKDISKKFNLS